MLNVLYSSISRYWVVLKLLFRSYKITEKAWLNLLFLQRESKISFGKFQIFETLQKWSVLDTLLMSCIYLWSDCYINIMIEVNKTVAWQINHRPQSDASQWFYLRVNLHLSSKHKNKLIWLFYVTEISSASSWMRFNEFSPWAFVVERFFFCSSKIKLFWVSWVFFYFW